MSSRYNPSVGSASPAPSPVAGPSKKRKKTMVSHDDQDDDNPNGGGDDGKKKGYSCSECHRRKQKCNREVPCQHCVSRKVPDRCHPFTPGKPEDDLIPRLLRLEKILSIHFPQYNLPDSLPDYPIPPGFPFALTKDQAAKGKERASEESEDEETREEEKDRGRGRLTKGKWFGVSAVGSMSEAPILEKLQADSATIELHLEDISNPAENLQRLITECGVSPTKVAELVQELPPKDFANILVDWFFSKINFTRYPIHEGMFRAAYEALYANGLRTDPANVRCLPLVFIILATAVRLAPEHIGGDDRTRRLTSLRYYWSSRRSILIATAIQSESLELVVTRLLSSRYLIMVHDRRLTECWSQLGASLRTAQAIGLHRDGTKLGLDAFQTEYRRRIWSYLYHADRTYSLILGRPPAISDAYTDTLPPSNLEDSELVPGVAPEPRPLNQPTIMTYSVLRHSLSRIIGKITHHFQQLVEPSHYIDVLKLDDELNAFVQSLPPHYRMDNPDKTLDQVLAAFLPMHRFFLITEILFVRITLHRPWLLRKLKSDRFLVSRNACFESAKRDFVVRQQFKKDCPTEITAVMGGQFREFNAAMIAGISAIVDPNGPEAPEMRGILATFLSDHPQAEMFDETTRKERSIIVTLHDRCTQLLERGNQKNGVGANGSHGVNDLIPTEHESHAHALLGLAGQAKTQQQQASLTPYEIAQSSRAGSSWSASNGGNGGGNGAAGGQQFSSPQPHWAHLLPDGSKTERGDESGRLASTPPSLEDESAQALLDQWCQENLSLDTVSGTQEQIFPAPNSGSLLGAGGGPRSPGGNTALGGLNHLIDGGGGAGAGGLTGGGLGGWPGASSSAMDGGLASLGLVGNGGGLQSMPGLGGLSSAAMDTLGGGGGGGGGATGGGAAGSDPADSRYWESLINSILAQGGESSGGGAGSHGPHGHRSVVGGPAGAGKTSPLANGGGGLDVE